MCRVVILRVGSLRVGFIFIFIFIFLFLFAFRYLVNLRKNAPDENKQFKNTSGFHYLFRVTGHCGELLKARKPSWDESERGGKFGLL